MAYIQPEPNMGPDRLGTPGVKSYLRTSRQTRGGRTLWYELEVLQQPERARACGSGPKSSADRRPVDPPPVVILRVYEGEDFDQKTHITFDYEVDFFCYASLENSRPMAHGRVQTPAATTPPVLTGFPVAGCCYLDRPDPAGYFLFPDLSVRHEGRYRLVFSLYELIKKEEDLDKGVAFTDNTQLPAEACHRMELKSADFTVYSAKKFPGLRTSTQLSRAVADQGCRVRIRRDVRVRKRDSTKNSGNDDHASNADEQYVKHQPMPDGYRARSASNPSMDGVSYPESRQSNVEYGSAPLSYQNGPPAGQVLNFGGQQQSHGFAQPAPYVPVNGANPHSTPVSPAQPMFPHGQTMNSLPTPQGYMPSPYQGQDERLNRPYSSYPPPSSRPLTPKAVDHRSSFSSNASTDVKPSLPNILPAPPALHAPPMTPLYSPYLDQQKDGLYPPPSDTRSLKRYADDDFAPHDHRRDASAARIPGTGVPVRDGLGMTKMEYGRASGAVVHKWHHDFGMHDYRP